MQRLIIILYLCVFFLEAAPTPEKQILLLQSYNKGLVWSDDLSHGVEEALRSYSGYELTTEYMDSKKNNDAAYFQHLYTFFAHKMRKQHYDVVIVADNVAVDFTLKYREKLFKDTPLIFTGLEKTAPGIDVQAALDEDISVIFENKQIPGNIDFIVKSLPNLEYLYVINDLTLNSKLINGHIKNALKKYDGKLKYKLYLDGHISQILKDFKNLPENSAVLFGSLFVDNNGKYVPYFKVNAMINASPVPIFSLSNSHLGKGVIGGHLLTGVPQGYEAGKIAIKLLNGESVSTKKPVIPPALWEFDYKILKKYGLSTDIIPKGSKIINLPKTFFEKYPEFVENVFLLFPFVLTFLLIAIFNIYQRHKMAKKLVAQDYLQQVLLNNLQSSVFWINTDGVVKGCNEIFTSLVGKSQNEIIGKKICDVFEVLCHLPRRKKLFNLEDIEFTLNEKNYLIRSKTFMDENKNNAGLVTVITDVTEKKQLDLNKQFIIQQSKLSEIGEMLSAIVHQWKTPLIDLSVVAHNVQRQFHKNNLEKKDVDSFFDTIMRQIIYMSDTIDGFRNFIRPSNKPVKFDLDNGIKEICNILEASMKYNKISLLYTNTIKESYTLFGYPNELKQVVLNIINNAKDAILEAREEKKSGTIHVKLLKDENALLLEITDDGIGIKEELLPKLFDPFFTTKEKGDGFGLYMARLIIENKMNGKIKAENIEAGSKITIELPIETKEEKS